MPAISERGLTLPLSPIRKLIPFSDAAKARGVKVYHLNIGQPDLPTPQKALDALKTIDRKTLSYTPSQGIKTLREKFSIYYDRIGVKGIGADDILVTTGGSEAILFVLMACLNPGDEVLLSEPGYANYFTIGHECGVKFKTITSSIDNGFALPPIEDFEKAITDKTKAIMICNPNNPTGYVYSEEELFKLRDIVKKHDLFLISDEVYREFNFTGEPYYSTLSLEGIEDNVVVIDSVSKRYSECGVRVGMIVTRNDELRKVFMKFCQGRLSPPILGQIIAEASIIGTEEYSKECFEDYLSRRNFFINGLNKIPGVHTPMPKGAFYTVVSLPVDSAEEFCKWCLTDFCYKDEKTPEGFTGETVMSAPAAGFYKTPGLGLNQVRMAYVLKVEDLDRSLFLLEKALEQYNSR